MTIAELVHYYIRLRDKRAELDKAHKAKMAKLKAGMDEVENHLQQYFNDAGADSVKTPHGTAYRSTRTSVRVVDQGAFRQFLEEQHAWDMLDARANKTAIETYLEQQGELPPGVSVNRIRHVNVKR